MTFFVIDLLSGTSEGAMATVNFASIDNPPVVDLNGPFVPGRDATVQFLEGADPVMVSTLQLPVGGQNRHLLYGLCF